MRKREFLYRLDTALESFPTSEREEIIHYYEELIQDALDNGEDEENFIDKLGSIDKIVRTIKKDSDFVENVKEKKNFELKQTFDKGVKIVGRILSVVALVVSVCFGIAFTIYGLNGIIRGVIAMVMTINAKLSAVSTLYYLGTISLFLGIMLLAITFIWYVIKNVGTKLELLYEKIEELFKKGGK